MTEFELINRFVDVDGTNKMIIGVWYSFFLRIDLNKSIIE